MELLKDYALSFVGVAYKYGGNSPAEGLDCSALVRWLLKSQGIKVQAPGNSQSLYDQFKDPANHLSTEPALGALVFYGGSIKAISHVSMCLNSWQQVEAAGGDPNTVSLDSAIRRSAFVRVTPLRIKDRMGIFMPRYSGL